MSVTPKPSSPAAAKFPVDTRATADLFLATGTGIMVPERTLGGESQRASNDAVVSPGWSKVTKSALSYENRFNVTLRDSLTKTQSSSDAPAFMQIPEVRRMPWSCPLAFLA